MAPSRFACRRRRWRLLSTSSLALAVLLLTPGPAEGQGPSMSGNVARGEGAPNGLRLAVQNSGGAPFQFARFNLAQPGSIQSIGAAGGPPGTQCQVQSPMEIFCQFPQPDHWPPQAQLIIDFFTEQPYPDNGGMQGIGCPAPCQPQGDVGPFIFPGPAPGPGPGPNPGPVPSPGPGEDGVEVPPGLDLFATDPSTFFDFKGPFMLPPGVVCPECEGFEGGVNFAGHPLGEVGGVDFGDADTIVRRNGPLDIPNGGGPSEPVPIELVALSLQSVEPIEVSGSFFDVFIEVSLSRPSPGSLTAMKTSDGGGSFSSQLTVFPKMIFKRDGEITGELDLGAGTPPPQLQEALTLRQQGGAFRFGCVAPALTIPGVTDLFCPGLTDDGRKRLTIEQALFARHAVYPAQMRLEHFQCYGVRQRHRFRSRVVSLRDQFGSKRVRVFRHRRLCNPARKNSEPWVNRQAHLECYDVTRRRAREHVAIRNQWGSRRLRTTRLRTLCVPSTKTSRRGSAPRDVAFTDHFACYDLRRTRSERRRVRVRDQFGRATLRIRRPVALCNPVSKNGSRIDHPIHHLVCYQAQRRVRRRVVRIRNQFGNRQFVQARRRDRFCVPSAKIEVRNLRG